MDRKILELIDVRKEYGRTVAVDGISLELSEGEFLTFLGSSGSGKTTTLVMIAGLQTPTSGSILLKGRPLDPLPPYRRNIGMVFQHYALFPHLTVARNIAFPLEMRGFDKAEIRKRVQAALEKVGLPDHGDRYPSQLSGGQQQRIALARAIVFEPPLLLMDEPLGALDKKLREQMQFEIMRLHKELGISVVYVTHDQQEALVMSDRVAVFKEGKIEQIGSPTELYERPATAFVADFIGESNFFSATVQSVEGQQCVLKGPYGTMSAYNTAHLPTGSRALVAVRPERLRVIEDDGHSGMNAIAGRVSDVIYLGQSRKYIVALDGGQSITVLQQAHEAERFSVNQGDALQLTWNAHEANVLAESRVS